MSRIGYSEDELREMVLKLIQAELKNPKTDLDSINRLSSFFAEVLTEVLPEVIAANNKKLMEDIQKQLSSGG